MNDAEINYLMSQFMSSDGYITVNKTLIKKFGLNCAVMLGELFSEYKYWHDSNKLENDMFYSTRENLEDCTGLTEHLQRKALLQLQNFGIITIKKRGLPAKNYYKINYHKLLNSLITSPLNFKELEIKNFNLNNNKLNNNISNTKVLDDNNNLSKDKLEKKPNLYSKCSDMIYEFTENERVRELLFQYLNTLLANYKDMGKSMYANGFKGKLNKLKQFPEDDWANIILNTLDNGWINFFPVDRKKANVVFGKEDKVKQEKFIEDLKKNGKRTVF